MDIFAAVRSFILITALGISAAEDLASGRIPNKVVIPCIAAVFLLDILSPPTADVSSAFLAAFIVLLFLFFSMRLVGGGDVKLYLLLALSSPDKAGAAILLLSVFTAGFIALFMSFSRLSARRKPPGCFASEIPCPHVRGPCRQGAGSAGVPMAFSLFLAAAAIYIYTLKGGSYFG